jgi:flagellar biosynthetic protein FliR
MTFPVFTLDELFRFLFLVVRVSGMFLAFPFLSSRVVPAHLKIVCVISLSISLYPAVRAQPIHLPQGPTHLGLLVLGELFIGMIIGFVAQVLFAGVQLGGTLMNQQMGLSMAHIFDPNHGQQTPIIANFQYILAVLLFFSVQGHHWFIYTLAESLHAIPLEGITVPRTIVEPVVELLSRAFVMAVKIAAPVTVALLLANIAMGIVARLVPQMNIFMLSFPLNLGIGLVILGLALPYVLGGFRLWFRRLGDDLFFVLQLLGGG